MTNKINHLLVIEDDKVDQMAFERFVKSNDFPFSYLLVGSIKDAKKAISEKKFNAILSDFYLGDGTAFDILDIIQDIPLVVVTGTGTEEIAVKALKKGAFDYLIKDVEGYYLTMIPITLQNALDRFKSQQELQEYQNNLERLVKERTLKLEQEINVRKEIETQIRFEKEFTETSLDAQQDTFFLFDFRTGKALRWNKAFRDKSGYSDKEIAKLTAPDSYYGAEDLKRAKQFINEVLEVGIGTIELNLICKSGDLIPTEYQVSVVNNRKGKPNYLISVGRDITERKQTEKILQDSEKKLREAQEMAHLGYWSWDVKSGDCEWSDETYKIFRLDPKTFTPNIDSIMKLSPWPEYKDRDKEIIQRAIDHRVQDSFEQRFFRPDGSIGYYFSTFLGIWDENDNLITIKGTIQDITSRKQAEKHLKESEERFDLAMNASQDGLYDWDLVTDKIYYSPSWKKMLGYADDELANDFSVWKKLTHPNDAKKTWKMLQELLSKKRDRFELEFKMKHKLGHWVDILSRAEAKFDSSGKGIRVVGTHVDITNHIRSEQIQKLLYNISRATNTSNTLEELIITIRDELGKVIDTKNYYIAFYDKQTDMLSLPFIADELDNAERLPAKNTLTGHVIKSKKPLLVTAAQQDKMEKEGLIDFVGPRSKIWLGVPLKADGDIIGVLAIQSYTNERAYTEADLELLEFVSDQISISIERKKADEALKEALKKATESDRLKSAFLATMSHELRTPLNAIIGFSDIISEELSLDDILKFCKNINSSGNHLLNIVEDLFDITLIETGKTQIHKTEEDLISILKHVHEIVEAELRNMNRKNVSLDLLIPNGVKTFGIVTDASKLKQIIINLVKNAIKFTKEGHVKYGYKIEKTNNKSWVKFFVDDTGIGIPKEMHTIIFDVFRQVDDSYTRTYGGTGIGLSISKKLTDLLGGEIWVESELDKGSTFYFKIPLEKGDPIAEPDTKTGSVDLKKNNKSILIVEDDKSSFEYLKTILEKSEINILKALNGVEAIQICQSKQNIDLVLMDINMPVMDGYKATKKIKKLRPKLPIIAQTAYAIAGDRKKSLNAGCDDYIAKPIKRELLYKLIDKYI